MLKTEDKEKNLKSGERKMTLLIGQRSTNYGPWAKSGSLYVLVNKGSLKYNHNYAFMHYL